MNKIRTTAITIAFVLVAGAVSAQSNAQHLLSINPLSPIFGIITGSYEGRIDSDLSFFVEPTLFVPRRVGIFSGLEWGDTRLWSVGAFGGAHYWFDNALEGFYVGGGPIVGYFYAGDDDVSFSGLELGAAGRIGHRWIWDWFSMAPYLGYRFTGFTGSYDAEDAGVPDTFSSTGGQFLVGVNFSIAF